MVRKIHYASSFHGQPNNNHPKAALKNNWDDVQKACASNVLVAPKGYAKSYYKYYSPESIPWTATGLDFKFTADDIPDCAYITNIKFEVVMKISGNLKVQAPQVRFNFYHGATAVKDTLKDYQGWKEGYLYKLANKKNVTNSLVTYEYNMTGDEFRKRGYPISELREQRMGIDLRFFSHVGAFNNDHTFYVQYVKCTVDFELPNHVITFKRPNNQSNIDYNALENDSYSVNPIANTNIVNSSNSYSSDPNNALSVDKYVVDGTSQSAPRNVVAGEEYEVVIDYENRSNANCCGANTRDLRVTLPPNAKVIGSSSNYNNGIWTVPCKAHSSSTLKLKLVDYGVGLNAINIYNSDVGSYNYWVNSQPNYWDVGDVTPFPTTMQKDISSCIKFVANVLASDGVANFYCNLDTVNNSASNIVWTLDEKESTEGVSIYESTDNSIYFNVPQNEYVHIEWKGCFVPSFTGDSNVSIRLNANPDVVRPYTVQPAPNFVVRNKPKTSEEDIGTMELILTPSTIQFKTHRLATSTEIEAYVIDCSYVNDKLVDEDCTVTASVWEKVDYIGVVPLEYHHYDPDSTYSNKAISDAYKNKTYKGKEGVIEEDIGLKFKVRPKQAPTLQGMVKLDKPTPINANHKCFESDPLNHRGWAVLSEVKFKKTNPLWYDCEAKVDYITHDIYTKFQIFNGELVNTQSMPSMMAEVFSLGENLSTGMDYFTIDTDGGFLYDEDGEDGAKNIFDLDEAQHLSIATRNPLANVSKIQFDWYSNKIAEDRENNLERIFRIKDKNGNAVLEYEYTDFQFFEDYITCDIIIRKKTEGEGWLPEQHTIDIRTELEAEPIAVDDGSSADEEIIDVEFEDVTEESDDEPDDTAYEEDYIAPTFDPSQYDLTRVYGSSLEFVLNGNKLKITDAGYNGREYESDEIILPYSESYSFETVWTNKNADGMTEDIISYIDVSLSETILSSDVSSRYTNLMVSPFPIPYKTVAFTRESEEGTIYYLQDKEPFKYRIEPFYQYLCGCDLLGEGISIFDLNNSYTHYYIENGLVRLGFNKYNGRLYLAKWDIIGKEWITTHYFHISEDSKFALESYSDDKIVIKAGNNTYFTIWRGHPYIGVMNPDEELFIDSKFQYCLADICDGQKSDYPKVYSFMNNHNLLPACIGGKKLDYDCFLIDDDDITTGTDHSLAISVSSDATKGVDTTFTATLSPSTEDGNVHYIVDNIDVGTVEYPFNLTHRFDKEGSHEVQAVYTGDEDDNIAISEKVVVNVANPDLDPNSTLHDKPADLNPGKYNLKMISSPKEFTYLDGEKVVLQLKKGNSVCKGYPIEIQRVSGATSTAKTDAQGKVYITNSNVEVGKYQWGGRFYDLLDEDENGELIDSALKWINVVKAKPTFTHNASTNKLNKGKYLHIKLNGAKSPLKKQKVTYTINKGSKTTKTTNDKGKIYIKFNEKDTYEIKVMYAGNKNYESISKKFTIKVV